MAYRRSEVVGPPHEIVSLASAAARLGCAGGLGASSPDGNS